MSPLEQIYAIVQALITMMTANTAKLTDLSTKYAALQADDAAKTQVLTEAQQHQAESDSRAQALLTQLQALQASLSPASDAPAAAAPSPVTIPTDTTTAPSLVPPSADTTTTAPVAT